MFTEQVDATDDPADHDRDAHDDESRERLQHDPSLGPGSWAPAAASPRSSDRHGSWRGSAVGSAHYDFAVSIRSVSILLLGGAVLISLTGCSSSEAGFGLPVLDDAQAESVLAGADADVEPTSGNLAVESNGCFTWRSGSDDAAHADRAWIVWPDDARQDGAEVVLGSGARIGEGAALDVVGAVVALADLPDGNTDDSYFGSFGGFCGADERGVLVVRDIEAG